MNPKALVLGLFVVLAAMHPQNTVARQAETIQTNLVREFLVIELVSFSPDGTLLTIGGNAGNGPEFTVCRASNLTVIWPEPILFLEGAHATSASFDYYDNRAVAFGTQFGDASAAVVDPKYALGYLSHDRNFGNVVAFSPSLHTYPLVVNAGINGIQKRRLNFTVYPFGLEAETFFTGSYQGNPVTALVIQPDGASFLLGNAAGKVQRWQVEPPQLLWQTNFPNHRVSAINVLSNGQQIVTLCSNTIVVGGESTLQDVRLWQVGATNWLQTIRPDLSVFSTALTPDAKYLFTVLAIPHNVPPYNPTFYTNHVALWRVSDGKLMVRYNEDLPDVQQVAVAPDGKTFAYGRGDGIVAIARMPTLVTKAEIRTNQFNFEWQGGSGLYQVQQATSVNAAVWANLGPATTATNLAVPMSNPGVFFRVRSVTNAP